MKTGKTRLVLLLLLWLLFLTVRADLATADSASGIFFREQIPLTPGSQEVLLQASETPRHLRVNLFSGEESIAEGVVWEDNLLRLRLTRAVAANETLHFLADGEDTAGKAFSLRQEWHISLYDALTRQVEAILREIERDWLPETGDIRLPYRLRQLSWVSALRAFDPGPEFAGDGSLILLDCSKAWLVHSLNPDGNIIGTWILDREEKAYLPPAANPSDDPQANPSELVISHEMKSPGNQVTEFVYDPDTLRLTQIRFLAAGFLRASFSLFCLPGTPETRIDSSPESSDSQVSPTASPDSPPQTQAYAILLVDFFEAERVRVIGRYDADGILYETETDRGLFPVSSPDTQIEGVVIVP